MKLRAFRFLVVLVICIAPRTSVGQDDEDRKVLICYFNSGSYYRKDMEYRPSDIDPTLCTHVIYSSLGIKEENNHVYSRNPSLDLPPGEEEPFPDSPDNAIGEVGLITKTVQIRNSTANPNLKVLISVGGLESESRTFSNMARHIANRTLFIRTVVHYMDNFELDGVDLYWKYPTLHGGRAEDLANFVTVLRDLRDAFTNLTTHTGRNYSIMAALGCTEDVITAGYDMIRLAEYVDYFNLHCYDFKMARAPCRIGHPSPLFHKISEEIVDQKLTAAYGVNHLISLNSTEVTKKLVLGISTHARTYTLGTPDRNNFYDLCQGPGPEGKFTTELGFLSYFEVCDEVKKGNSSRWQFRYDHDYKVPYVCNNEEDGAVLFGYDNEISAKEKVDFAIGQHGLAGMMISALDMDDYQNICEGWFPYPITSAVRERLEYHRNMKK